jgi:hypothetical protein
MFVTITEKWDYDHGNDRRLLIHQKLNEMELTGKFVRVKFGGINDSRSVYNFDGSPTKTFNNLDSTNEYINFFHDWPPPLSMTIKLFDNEKDYIEYLNSVTDNNYVGESGPCA